MLGPNRASEEAGSARLALGEDIIGNRGWRRERRDPSLAEVFGSIKTRPTGPLWKSLPKFLAPITPTPPPSTRLPAGQLTTADFPQPTQISTGNRWDWTVASEWAEQSASTR